MFEEKMTDDIPKEEEPSKEDDIEEVEENSPSKNSDGNNDWDSDIEEDEDF